MRTKINSIYFILIFIFTIISTNIFSQNAFASDKNILLVLDTSLSMVGHGGKNILEKVKKKINEYIDKNVDDGDQVTFITFDTTVKVFPPVLVDDNNDRDILKKYISMTEAKGQWTHTYEMARKVYETAEGLDKEDDDRKIIIIVMTDALDDPPPHKKGQTLGMNEISEKKEWWVYFVNFGTMKKNKNLSSINELSKRVKHTKVIESGKDPDKGLDKFQEVIEKEKQQQGFVKILLISILIIALVLFIIYYFWRFSQLKVVGKLEYWNNAILDPYTETINLTKRRLREALVGRGTGSSFQIREFEVVKPFAIIAQRDEGDVKMAIVSGGNAMEFINRDVGKFLKDGDIFKVNNYTFKYTKT